MDIFLVYLYVVVALLSLLFLQQYFHPRPTSRIRRIYRLFRRHITLPYLLRRRTPWGPITRLQAVIYSIYIGGTVTCNVFRATELDKARARAGSLALLHLSLLPVVPRLVFGAAFFGTSLHTYHQIHRAIGTMAIFQSVLHIILSIQTSPFDLQEVQQKNGLIVSNSILIRGSTNHT
jgi:hypothetical protein